MHVGCIVCGHLYRGGIEYIYLGLGRGSVCFGCVAVWYLWVCVPSSLAPWVGLPWA